MDSKATAAAVPRSAANVADPTFDVNAVVPQSARRAGANHGNANGHVARLDSADPAALERPSTDDAFPAPRRDLWILAKAEEKPRIRGSTPLLLDLGSELSLLYTAAAPRSSRRDLCEGRPLWVQTGVTRHSMRQCTRWR